MEFSMSSFGLAEILWPTSIDEFSQKYFDIQPICLARTRADYYSQLLTLEEVDGFLSFARPPFARAFAIDHRRKIEPSEYSNADGLADAGRLFDLYAGGATIVLREIEDCFPKLGALCRSAEKHFNFPFTANVYLAPPGGQSFPIHFDAKDVFALQISGSKNWRLYQPRYPMPLSYQHCYDSMPDEGFLKEFDLQPGDFLYIPRGFPHVVRATDIPSLHVSLSTFPLTWADVMKRIVVNLCESDPSFRASLPPACLGSDVKLQKTFTSLMERFASSADLEAALSALKREFIGSRAAHLTNPIMRRQKSEILTLESLMGPSPDLLYQIDIEQGTIRLIGLGKDIRFGRSALDDLIYALETPSYRIGDTPGNLAPEGKLDMFRTLYLFGFVTLQ